MSPQVSELVALLTQATPAPPGSAIDVPSGAGPLFEAIVAFCAFSALLLSIWQEFARRQSAKPQIRVTMGTGIIGLPQGASDAQLLVEAANIGEKAVTLSTQAQLKLPDGRRFLLPPRNTHVQFPYELHSGKNCVTWIPLAQLAENLREAGFSGKCMLLGTYRDQIGNVYRSQPFEFDASAEWTS
jgi:hypothetical protein